MYFKNNHAQEDICQLKKRSPEASFFILIINKRSFKEIRLSPELCCKNKRQG